MMKVVDIAQRNWRTADRAIPTMTKTAAAAVDVVDVDAVVVVAFASTCSWHYY